MKLCLIRTNFETTINKSINHAKFVHRWQETFKMGVHTARCRLPYKQLLEIFRFPEILLHQEMTTFHFFSCSKEKDMFG